MNLPHSDALVFFGATGELIFKKVFPSGVPIARIVLPWQTFPAVLASKLIDSYEAG